MHARIGALHRRERECRQHRESDYGLADDHRLLGEQQLPRAERPLARKQDVQDQADDHRRKGQQPLDQDNDEAPAGKALVRQDVAQDNRGRRRQGKRGQRYPQGNPDDGPQFGVAGEQQRKRLTR